MLYYVKNFHLKETIYGFLGQIRITSITVLALWGCNYRITWTHTPWCHRSPSDSLAGYQRPEGGSADSVEMLDKGRIHHGILEISSCCALFKTYNLFISGTFYVIFWDHSWPQVTESTESKTSGKRKLAQKWNETTIQRSNFFFSQEKCFPVKLYLYIES